MTCWRFRDFSSWSHTVKSSPTSFASLRQNQNNILLDICMSNHLRSTRSHSKPPSRSSDWSAWSNRLWAKQCQCSSQEIFPEPLETKLKKKYTTVHKCFGFSDIVCCDYSVNLKLATGRESEKHLPIIITIINGGNMPMTKTHPTS